MLTTVTQRWDSRTPVYRPSGEPINTRLYEVVELHSDAVCREFVEKHHYSRSYPAARRRFGLYRGNVLCGIAVFSVAFHHVMAASFSALLPPDVVRQRTVELGRLVLLDEVPANGESWFVAECFARLRREGFEGVMSMSDPCPRRNGEGIIVFPGHIGTVYQSLNAAYTGRSRQSLIRLLPDGTVLHSRTLQKILTHCQGWRYSAELLVQHGAPEVSEAWSRAELTEWAIEWVPRVTTRMMHGGNHRYVWLLHRGRHVRKLVPMGQSYPKVVI